MSTAAAQSPTDLANLALVRMGYRLRIGSLFDGSMAAKRILDVYAQARDDLIREMDPRFSERNLTNNAPLKTAPIANGVAGYFPPAGWSGAANPPVPWLYEYAYPGDCLKVRAVKPVPIFVPNFDPQPFVFDTVNDNYLSPAQRVIVCNVAPPMALVYTAQVTDPTSWDVSFVSALAEELAKILGPALVGMDSTKVTAPEAQVGKAVAEMEQG